MTTRPNLNEICSKLYFLKKAVEVEALDYASSQVIPFEERSKESIECRVEEIVLEAVGRLKYEVSHFEGYPQNKTVKIFSDSLVENSYHLWLCPMHSFRKKIAKKLQGEAVSVE